MFNLRRRGPSLQSVQFYIDDEILGLETRLKLLPAPDRSLDQARHRLSLEQRLARFRTARDVIAEVAS